MKLSVLSFFLMLFLSGSRKEMAPLSICISAEEKKLYDLIMEYRKSKNLKSIPFSSKLSQVAQAHTHDLNEQYKFDVDNKCNPHSWSKKGKWSSCCYTPDHKQAKCMWDKPAEIAKYNSPGYEIAYYNSAGVNALEGLEGWKKSPAHNPLLINEGIWKKIEWNAIGISLYKEYGVVWFGNLADNDPQPVVCQ